MKRVVKYYFETEILLTLKEKRALREELSVSPNTMNRALAGTSDSYGVRQIRKRAIEIGGVERVIKNEKSADELTDDQNNSTVENTNVKNK